MADEATTEDPSAVIDTFTAIEYDNTYVYLYGDRLNFCIMHKDLAPIYGQSNMGPLVAASAAWTNWQSQTPDDVWQLITHAYSAVQDLGSTSRTVAEAANTVDQAAKIVAEVAGVVGVICLLTGIASAVAGAMAGVDAVAIRAEHIAEQIYHHAAQLNWQALDMLPAIREVEVTHTVGPTAQQLLGTIQQELEQLLNLFQQVIAAAV
jgi:hypothetical protein